MWYPEAGEKGERLKNSWVGRFFPAFTTITKTLHLIAQDWSIFAWKPHICGILFFYFKMVIIRARRLISLTIRSSF